MKNFGRRKFLKGGVAGVFSALAAAALGKREKPEPEISMEEARAMLGAEDPSAADEITPDWEGCIKKQIALQRAEYAKVYETPLVKRKW